MKRGTIIMTHDRGGSLRTDRPRGVVRVLLTAAAIQWALFPTAPFAEIVPVRGVADSRVRSAPYDGDQVYRVRGVVGYQIDFEFEPGETFVGLGAGDLDGLSFFGEGNHLFLKPKAAKVTTNLTVLTNRRRYQIDYTADAHGPGADDPDVIYAVRFIYPPPSRTSADREAARIDRGPYRRLAPLLTHSEHRLLVLRESDA